MHEPPSLTSQHRASRTKAIVAWVVLAPFVAAVAFAAPAAVKPGKVEVELIADDAAQGAGPRRVGSPIRIGLRMKMDPGWHTYWKNPGDAGMPARIAWTLPHGWSVGDIEWPAPERIPVGSLASYGYAGEVVLPMLLFAPRDWSGAPTPIEAKAEWLVCKESCLPEAATVTMTVTDRSASSNPSAHALFAAARARQPQAVVWRKAVASRAAGNFTLALAPAVSGEFFPDLEELVEPGDPPRVTVDGDSVQWSARLGNKGRQLAIGTPVRGVWVPKVGKPLLVEAVLER